MTTKRNWFKRLFTLDYDDSVDQILDLIEVHELWLSHTDDKLVGVQEAVKYVSSRVDTAEAKLAALKTFDFFGRTIIAQFDVEKRINADSSITVSIDNVAAQAWLRFGSVDVVDTIDAVWFISKTGNTIINDFGDVLHPAAQRRDVKDFLYMTSEKQGDEPIDILVPPHHHPGAIISDDPPDPASEGDLWWDAERMEMFIRYEDAWITTNALGARVEAGEAVQAELLERVAAGEQLQTQLTLRLDALESLTEQNKTDIAANTQAIDGKADTGHGHSDKADKNHTHDDLIPVPVSYRLETDANLRGKPSIQLVDSDDNFSDVSFTAGEGVEITSQPSGMTMGLSDEHLEQVDQNRQDIQLLWAATGDKMEIETIIQGQWMFIGENKTNPRDGQFSMNNWYFNKVTQIVIGEFLSKGSDTWKDIRVNDEIHIVDESTGPDGELVPEADRYQGKYIVKTVNDNSGSILTCVVELVHAVGTIRENKVANIKIRGARVPDHTGRIDDQDKLIQDILEKVNSHHKVLTWKYRGYGVSTSSLKQGEFTIWKERGNLIIRMHRYDSMGKYWAWNTQRSHPLNDPIAITDPGAGGIVYIADGTEFRSLMGENPNFYCEAEGNEATEIHSMKTGTDYVINIPGLTPQFVKASALGGYKS